MLVCLQHQNAQMPLTASANCYRIIKLHGQNTGSEAGTAEWVAQVRYLLAVLPWVSHLTSLCLFIPPTVMWGWQCLGCGDYRN